MIPHYKFPTVFSAQLVKIHQSNDHGSYHHCLILSHKKKFPETTWFSEPEMGSNFTMIHFHHFNQYNWSLPWASPEHTLLISCFSSWSDPCRKCQLIWSWWKKNPKGKFNIRVPLHSLRRTGKWLIRYLNHIELSRISWLAITSLRVD